jgi:glutamine---fructose-6-phosphate transaminase (isomerizing)
MNKEYNFIKEIRQQPRVIDQTLQEVDDQLRNLAQKYAGQIDRIILTGCGDPYMLSLAAVYAFENWAGVPAEAIEAAEFAMYRHALLNPRTLVVLISSSGKTVKVIDAARLCTASGSPTIALTNIAGSPITEETENVVQTRAGWSDSFPTKQTTTALAVLLAFALHWAALSGALSQEQINRMRSELYEDIPRMVDEALNLESEMEAIAQEMAQAPIFTFIGSGPNLSTALQGAAKMKETSQSRAEASNLEEYAHLHCLTLKAGDPIFVITASGDIDERNLNVCKHIQENDGRLVVIGPNSNRNKWDLPDMRFVGVPDHDEMFGGLVALIPLQLFAYYLSLQKNRNPDRPPQRGPMDYLQKIIYTSMLEGWEKR